MQGIAVNSFISKYCSKGQRCEECCRFSRTMKKAKRLSKETVGGAELQRRHQIEAQSSLNRGLASLNKDHSSLSRQIFSFL